MPHQAGAAKVAHVRTGTVGVAMTVLAPGRSRSLCQGQVGGACVLLSLCGTKVTESQTIRLTKRCD